MNTAIVRRVHAADVIDVRWAILRPGFPRESAFFEGDAAAETQHFGAFDAGQIAGVASIYRALLPERPEWTEAWQLRGMATLPEVRGKGLGKALVQACVDAAWGAGAKVLWCNARVAAAEFYARQKWTIVGKEFDIPTVGPHYRMMVEFGGL
jgi:GNAT superfamily N-acetyltransferase